MTWFNSLPVQVQAAIIAATFTLAGILFRDVVLKAIEARKQHRKNEMEVYRRYADPLASAASSLLWRLNEIFHQKGRESYLIAPATEFERYKKTSSVYRIASLLGWIRAFRRELSFFEVSDRRRLTALKSALRALESASPMGLTLRFNTSSGWLRPGTFNFLETRNSRKHLRSP